MIRRHKQPQSTKTSANDVGGDMAVITCHFNWAGFMRPAQNLHRFIRQMEAFKIPVYGVEAALPGRGFQTKGLRNWKQITTEDEDSQVMFQKERLLNIAEKMVPGAYKKLAWLDADIFFENMNWFAETATLLDHFAFVQPFETAAWTDIDGKEVFRRIGTLRMGGGMPSVSHPGFAMAARRSLWTRCGGLFEHLIVGNGDVGIASAILGEGLPWTQTYSDELLNEYQRWKTIVISNLGQDRFGWVHGTVWHEWHGSMRDRDYIKRNQALKALEPLQHLERAENGLTRWSPKAPPALKQYVRDYFRNRMEDGGGSLTGATLSGKIITPKP